MKPINKNMKPINKNMKPINKNMKPIKGGVIGERSSPSQISNTSSNVSFASGDLSARLIF